MSPKRDPFDLIQRANPVPDPDRLPDRHDSASAWALIEEIIATAPESGTRSRRRRRAALLVAASLAVIGVGATWALSRQAEQTTRIHCPGNAIVAAVSGDPIEDCANELRRQGTEPPEMAAYLNERGGVVVVALGSEIPPEWQALDGGFRQDTAVIELEAALADVTTGLEARCYTSTEAVPIVERELARLGLDWSVTTSAAKADGDTTCALAALEAEQAQVTVYPIDGVSGDGDEPWVALGTRLNQALSNECLSLDEAAATARGIALEVGLDPAAQQARITATADNNAACTRATVTVGGTVFVDLRGPNPR